MKSRFIGIGEYTRNSLYGSLFVVGVSVPRIKLADLESISIGISKNIPFGTVDEIATEIIEKFDFEVCEISPEEIENNKIDKMEMCAYIKCFSHLNGKDRDFVLAKNFLQTKDDFVKLFDVVRSVNISMENWNIIKNVSRNSLVCFVANFLAKYYYDYYFQDIKNKYMYLGNGKPSNIQTKRFIKRNKLNPPYFIRAWANCNS